MSELNALNGFLEFLCIMLLYYVIKLISFDLKSQITYIIKYYIGSNDGWSFEESPIENLPKFLSRASCIKT